MTLLEALVVVAATALIAAIGFPALHAAGTAAHLRSQSEALIADLHRARAASIHLDRPVTLAADRDGGGWRWDGGELRLDPELRLKAQAPIVFYPDGSSGGGDLALGTPARTVHIAVDRVTGQTTTIGR